MEQKESKVQNLLKKSQLFPPIVALEGGIYTQKNNKHGVDWFATIVTTTINVIRKLKTNKWKSSYLLLHWKEEKNILWNWFK